MDSLSRIGPESKVFVAGHRGLVGSAIVRALDRAGYQNVITRTRNGLDLSDQQAVYGFLKDERPDAVFVAAAKVGGIHANRTLPADFIQENLILEHNVIWGSHVAEVPNLLFLGSSCVYPREAAQPMSEDCLLTGRPEPTNAPYAIAKIAGIALCDAIQQQYGRNYFSVMPPNIFGPNDNFDLATSHVLPALIRKFHEALPDKPVEVWGTGTPKREFLHSDDLADGCLFLMERGGTEGHINVGTGESITIAQLAKTIQEITGHQGEIIWNTKMPDGFPEHTMNVSRAFSLGWRPKLSLQEGIGKTYEWFVENQGEYAARNYGLGVSTIER